MGLRGVVEADFGTLWQQLKCGIFERTAVQGARLCGSRLLGPVREGSPLPMCVRPYATTAYAAATTEDIE